MRETGLDLISRGFESPRLQPAATAATRASGNQGLEGEEMDQAQALVVVRSLANGVDPESGEVFPAESAYQKPQVVRALYAAATALERIERFDRRRAQMPPKTGEPWSENEDRKLLAAFDAGRSLHELAAAHERTMGAVRARLLKYGRINA